MVGGGIFGFFLIIIHSSFDKNLYVFKQLINFEPIVDIGSINYKDDV